MTAEPREPARLPIRGTIATVGTVGALTLLLSFRGGPLSPTEPILAADETPATDELITAQAETETTGADAALGPVSYTGDAFETRWGDVRVEVTLDGTDIIDVVALQMPDTDRHTVQLGAYVEPILRDEAIAADSADVSVISGATYTSEAYADSLQSALDEATMATADASVADAPEAIEPGALAGPASDEVRTATGDAVAIRWGDVQVAVRVEGDDIIDVETIAIPADDRRSQRINTNAEPILREEAIARDSADVSVVSGATYTSQAYARSLQSALDQLGI